MFHTLRWQKTKSGRLDPIRRVEFNVLHQKRTDRRGHGAPASFTRAGPSRRISILSERVRLWLSRRVGGVGRDARPAHFFSPPTPVRPAVEDVRLTTSSWRHAAHGPAARGEEKNAPVVCVTPRLLPLRLRAHKRTRLPEDGYAPGRSTPA